MEYSDEDYFDELDARPERIERRVVQPTQKIFESLEKYGLQTRDGQYRLALDIAESIRNGNNLMGEAGVGIGKTYAYLIPGMFAAESENKPLIIATSSIALTKQLLEDVKVAQRITNLYHLQAEIVKGANNYVCLKKVNQYKDDVSTLKNGNPDECMGLNSNLLTINDQVWRDALHCYDRDTLAHPVDNWVWELIQCRTNYCSSETCTYENSCEFKRMRKVVGDNGTAKIIIANQDVLIASFINYYKWGHGTINSEPVLLVIDEGHNFEEKTRAALTESFTLEKLIRPLLNAEKALSNIDSTELLKNVDDTINAIKRYFDEMLKKIQKRIAKDPENRSQQRFDVPKYKDPKYLLKLVKFVESAYTSILFQSRNTKRNNNITDDLILTKDLLQKLHEFHEGGNPLFWGEGNIAKPETIKLCWAPKNIDKVLNRWLFSNYNYPVIITSATLCQPGNKVKDTYKYQTEALGFNGAYTPSQLSPFNYNKNAMLYIAADLPDPTTNRDAHTKATALRIIELIKYTHGRTLVLFTSKEDMGTVYQLLKDEKLPWEILIQKSGGGNQHHLYNTFIKTKGVLLSTNYWEGFNVPGPDLSQVIIVRLPFPVPDPIIDYKSSLVENSIQVTLPEMLVKLRQGAGRLIRKEEDTGILSILDPRIGTILNKTYRKHVLNSLSIKNMTENLDEIKEYCQINIVLIQK